MSGLRVSRMAPAMLEYLLLAAIAVVAILAIVQPIVGPGGLGIGSGRVFGQAPSVEATIDASRVRVETVPELPSLAERGEVAAGEAVEFTVPTGSTVSVLAPDWRQRLGLIGAEVLGGLVAIAVLLLLLALVRSLRNGDPFVAANARRLYAMATVVALGGQAAVLLAAWGRAIVLSSPLVAPYVVEEFEITFLPLLAGVGIAVAAEVFRQGTALRHEVEGLV